MKLQGFKKYLLVILLLGFCGSGWATPYPLPDPLPPLPLGVTLGDDIDGPGLFIPGTGILSFEIFDRGDQIPIIQGYEFGFYYGSNSSELITIFDTSDITTSFGSQRAEVNFTSGQVFDQDFGGLVQSSFTSLGTAPIGFYIQLPSDVRLFTQALLNDGGDDLSAAYPVFGAPPLVPKDSYLIGFRNPSNNNAVVPIYASVVGPLNPVPVPGAIFLWLTGLAGLALFRRSLAAGSPVTATAAR